MKAQSKFLVANHLPLLTSDYVLDETVTLLKSRLGHSYAVKFLDALQASGGASHGGTLDENHQPVPQ